MSQSVHIGLIKILTSIGGGKLKTIKLLDYLLGSLITFCIIPRKKISFPKSIQKILVIRPGGIGDAIFLLPILRNLKQNNPALTIDILCESRNVSGFISQKDCYNRLFCYNRGGEFKIVFRQSYDLVIDTEQWHFFSSLVAFFMKTTYRIGFDTRPLRSKLFEETHPYSHDAYELENFKELFKHILNPRQPISDSIEHSFTVSHAVKQWAQNQITENTVSLFLGASIAIRRLTKQQSLNIINDILKKNHHIVLLGGKDIEEDATEIFKSINHPSVHNFAGKSSLEESAGLIQRSRLFIGPDSGLMHVACAVGTRVVGIFGPGNAKKWGPRGTKHHTINLNCCDVPHTYFGYTNLPSGRKEQWLRELNINAVTQFI